MVGPMLYGGILLVSGFSLFLIRKWLGRVAYDMRLELRGANRAKSPQHWAHVNTIGAIWLCSIGGLFVLFSLLSLVTG